MQTFFLYTTLIVNFFILFRILISEKLIDYFTVFIGWMIVVNIEDDVQLSKKKLSLQELMIHVYARIH